MLTCLPASLCSWNYRVLGESGEYLLNFLWGEQGDITVGPDWYGVRKHGMFSGRWTLELNGVVIGEARKPSAFSRGFELTMPEGFWLLDACSAFGRAYRLHASGREESAEFTPAHAFTRRASITGSPGIPLITRLFAFWLVAVIWKRQSDASSS